MWWRWDGGGGISKRRKKKNHYGLEPPCPPMTVLSAKTMLMNKEDKKGTNNQRVDKDKQLAENMDRVNLYKEHVDIFQIVGYAGVVGSIFRLMLLLCYGPFLLSILI